MASPGDLFSPANLSSPRQAAHRMTILTRYLDARRTCPTIQPAEMHSTHPNNSKVANSIDIKCCTGLIVGDMTAPRPTLMVFALLDKLKVEVDRICAPAYSQRWALHAPFSNQKFSKPIAEV